MIRISFVSILIYFITGPAGLQAQTINYPQTKKVTQVDDYFGTKVEDPYRWLEDDNSAETALWVDMQNEVTEKYLVQIPFRKRVRERLTALSNYEKYSAPEKAGEYYFFTRNTGLQNQSVICYTKGINDSAKVFLDPNEISADGSISLSFYVLSPDGRYLAYALSTAGSDWVEIRVMEVSTRKLLDDKVEWGKFTTVAWKDDGFYYGRYDAIKTGNAYSLKNEYHKIYYHKLGTNQKNDVLIYEDKASPQRLFYAQVTSDGRYLIISSREATPGNNLVVKDLRKPKSEFITLVEDFKNKYSFFGSIGDSLLVLTNMEAPRGRILCVDMSRYVKGQWDELIPQQEDVMTNATQSMMRIILTYMKDASSLFRVYYNNGLRENEIKFSTPGTIDAISGDQNDSLVFFSVSSFTFPSRIFRYHVRSKKEFIHFDTNIDFNSDDYTVSILQYYSKDSTMIPMFVVYRNGLEVNGSNPTMLFGYGGFNISKTPEFKPERLLFLENGGVFAMANIRGGGEFGQEWHQAGTKLKKQNVFDDFIGAAEYLINAGITNPSKLAISGRSNGGLLVGAAMTQRPELFKVALPAVGVMDMLRYHRFTIGWSWKSDYGSSENKEEFNAIYKYSPLHRLSTGVSYPATMVTTADHDDRVVPAHSFKFIATLQEKNAGSNPVLIRIDKDAGHGGSGKPMGKLINEQSDIFSFLMYNLGMSVK